MLAEVDEPIGSPKGIPELSSLEAKTEAPPVADAKPVVVEPNAKASDAPSQAEGPVEIAIGTPPDENASPAQPASPEDLWFPDPGPPSVVAPPAKPARADDGEAARKTPLEQAFPVDQLRHGTQAASQFFSWGFSQVKQQAQKAQDELNKSSTFASAQKFVVDASEKTTVAIEQAGTQVITNVEKISTDVEKIGTDVGAKVITGVEKISTDVKTGVDKMTSDIQPTISEAAASTSAAADVAREKTEELAQALKPAFREAQQSTKTALFSFASNAAKTAIWFQSLGSHNGPDSDDEQEGTTKKTDANGTSSAPVAQATMDPLPSPAVPGSGGYAGAPVPQAQAMTAPASVEEKAPAPQFSGEVVEPETK
jgi:hypothetical protein